MWIPTAEALLLSQRHLPYTFGAGEPQRRAPTRQDAPPILTSGSQRRPAFGGRIFQFSTRGSVRLLGA